MLFDEMRERGGAVDKVAYTNAVRAAGHVSSSSARVTQLLHDALAELGSTRATQVFNAALANLKFLDRSVTVSAAEEQTVLDHARELVEWMVRSKMAISSQTMVCSFIFRFCNDDFLVTSNFTLLLGRTHIWASCALTVTSERWRTHSQCGSSLMSRLPTSRSIY